MITKIIQRNSTLIILAGVIISIWYFWPVEPNPYADVPRFAKIDFNDGDECYRSYAFQNEQSLKYRLKTVFEMESLLQQENKRKILFHKTDCIHDGVIELSARQACAVESAALTNPSANVFVIYASEVGYTNTSVLPLIDAVQSYDNVLLTTLNIDKNVETYIRDTPLKDWIKNRAIFNSPYIQTHMNDFLRAATLFNYGGTAMDMDVVVQKDLEDLKDNFAAVGTSTALYCGVLNLAKDEVGHEIASKLLNEFIGYYSPQYFGSNGHWYLMRVMQERCNCSEKQLKDPEMNVERCKGFKIYPKNHFFAIDWSDWLMAFETVNSDIKERFMGMTRDSYMVHFLDPMSRNQKVKLHGGSGYDLLAERYCPKVYSTLKEDF